MFCGSRLWRSQHSTNGRPQLEHVFRYAAAAGRADESESAGRNHAGLLPPCPDERGHARNPRRAGRCGAALLEQRRARTNRSVDVAIRFSATEIYDVAAAMPPPMAAATPTTSRTPSTTKNASGSPTPTSLSATCLLVRATCSVSRLASAGGSPVAATTVRSPIVSPVPKGVSHSQFTTAGCPAGMRAINWLGPIGFQVAKSSTVPSKTSVQKFASSCGNEPLVFFAAKTRTDTSVAAAGPRLWTCTYTREVFDERGLSSVNCWNAMKSAAPFSVKSIVLVGFWNSPKTGYGVSTFRSTESNPFTSSPCLNGFGAVAGVGWLAASTMLSRTCTRAAPSAGGASTGISHTPRPLVAARKRRRPSWSWRSVIAVFGSPSLKAVQLAPSSVLLNTPG